MNRYELMDRAGIEISEEDYDKIATVYMEMSIFRCVGDVVNYIKKNKGIQGILDLYHDAKELAVINKAREEVEAQLIATKREVREKDKVIEYLCSLLTTEQIVNGVGMDKAKVAELLLKEVA